MIKEQEKIRKESVYKAVKAKMVNKPYFTKTSEIFKEVASIFGYNERSVSNIYYELRKEEEKKLHKIRVSKKQGSDISKWFIERVTKWHELTVKSNSSSQIKKDFSINPLPRPAEYSFEFWLEASYKVVKSGDGKNEPIITDVVINSYSLELTKVYNADGEEIILQQKYIQEIEDHLYSILKLSIDYHK